jgi:poly(hydroxyalkanoate) depolymerase family esterase
MQHRWWPDMRADVETAMWTLPGDPRRDAPSPDRLSDLEDFGPNPGQLRARIHVPARLPANPALVVVLHGCTQTAADYDAGSGWSRLADRKGFVLLYPEQRRANNPNLCFNWFSPEDTRRGGGEAASIHQMIAAVVAAHEIDPARIFVTGLSAGGAMAAVMLAAYPELFAGGAIIAGLPYGCASNVQQAFGAMRARGAARPEALAALVRDASGHEGPWPRLSVWHGSGDATVNPENADAIVDQWRALHGLAAAPSARETVDGYPRRVWRDAAGHDVIEAYAITGMGHGTPLATLGEDGCGRAGPFMLEAAISSSRRIADFWGIDTADASATMIPDSLPAPIVRRATRIPPVADGPAAAGSIARIIDDALRSAGLLR